MPPRIDLHNPSSKVFTFVLPYRFMAHACCQTFLNLLWMQYMDCDTSKWKLFPLLSFVPFINIPSITFDKHNLAYGIYKNQLEEHSSDRDGQRKAEIEGS